MKPEPKAYQPISCDFYDELELRALRQKECQIVYLDPQGNQQEVIARIKDLQTRDREEFMLLSTGIEFRLDRLISIDGKLNGVC